RGLARDEHDFRLDYTGVADEAAARLDDRLWNGVAEMLAQRAEDRAPVGLELRRLAQVARREAAAEVDGGERDAALGAGTEHGGARRQRRVPGVHVVLLRSHVEGDAVRQESAAMREFE